VDRPLSSRKMLLGRVDRPLSSSEEDVRACESAALKHGCSVEVRTRESVVLKQRCL
jgi:hypothetical protein